jgi:Flp pilus assembly protein TadD
VSDAVPTLATTLHAIGFRTGAFVAAFPLDHQFGLNRGFDVYGDRMPRGSDGRLMNECPGSQVVDEATAWLGSAPAPPAPPAQRFFLWIHLFEPHAPYGDPASGRSTIERYDDEIATADREVGRVIEALGSRRQETLIVVASDHGEAFGEHGEYAHSIFVYDTTLRVPLIFAGPEIGAVRSAERVTLADVAPTVVRLLGTTIADVDGIDIAAALSGGTLPARELYAESFAPVVEFGWAPLRSIRSENWKFIAAPRPELYDVDKDPDERVDVSAAQTTVVRRLDTRTSRYSPANLPSSRTIDASGLERLRALGYANGPRHDADVRVDPKDRREVAARIAQVTSGELTGAALVSALEDILRVDPSNGQAHLRLGYALLQQNYCARATEEFRRAIDGGLPTADAHLGLATCLGRANDLAGAERVLNEAKRREPDNPVIIANVGILQAAKGDLRGAIASLERAVSADPGLLEARFNLAIAYAKAGRRSEAVTAARDLLARLPPTAPQRAEVERLLRAVQ